MLATASSASSWLHCPQGSGMEIFRRIVERRLRGALTLGGVAAGILAFTLTGATAEHFEARLAGGIAYYRSNIQVVDAATGSAGVVSLGKVDPIQRLPGVAVALPSISVPARPGSMVPTSFGLPEIIVYRDPRERVYAAIQTDLAAGGPLQPSRQGQVVLGADLADELGVTVGDSVSLPVRPPNANPYFVNHTFHVVGILKRTNALPDITAEVGLLDAQTLLQESLPASFRDRVDPTSLASGITVYGKPGTDLDRLADLINANVPGVTATRPTDYVSSFDAGAQRTAIAALLAVLFGAVVVATGMNAAVIERRGEIAVKMAFGAKARHIVAEHMLEATTMGLAGGVMGVAVALGVATVLDLAGRWVGIDIFLVTGRLALIALGLAGVLGAGGGIVPALRATRLDPDLALRAS
jgi:putative ABC transport system permease protein